MKCLKVELTLEEDNGRVVTRTLEGEDAQRWLDWTNGLCMQAANRHSNPDWGSLKWQTAEAQKSANV